MSNTSNNKRFGSAEEIQTSDRKSKCSCSNAQPLCFAISLTQNAPVAR